MATTSSDRSAPSQATLKKRRPRGSGGVTFHRASGLWRATLPPSKDGTGEAPSHYAASRAEAEAWLDQAIKGRESGRQVRGRLVRVSEVLDRWYGEADREKGWAPNTRRTYAQAISDYLRPRIGHIDAKRLTVPQVKAMRDDIATQHGSKAALNALARLRTALGWAMAEDIVDRNVAKLVASPRYRRSVPEPWSLEQAARFMDAVEGHPNEAIWKMAITMGCRPGELLAVCDPELRLHAQEVVIATSLTHEREDWTAKREKGGPRAEPVIKGTKGEVSKRVVAIPPEVMPALKARLAQRDADRAAAGASWRDNGLVFCDALGRPLRGDTLHKQFRAFCEAAGLPPVRTYDLRRTAIVVQLIATNGNVVAVGKNVGHSRVSDLAADLYAYLPPEVSQTVAAKVGDVLASARAKPNAENVVGSEVGRLRLVKTAKPRIVREEAS